MRKTLLFVTAASLAFTACKKNGHPEQESDKDIYELPYNKEGITANKAFLESEGRTFVKQINDLPNEQAIKALESLAELNVPELDITVQALAKMGQAKEKIAAIHNTLAQVASAATAKESYKLSEAYGIYNYNATTEEWDKTAATDRIEFKFPAIKGGKTNNATLTLTYTSSGKSVTYTEEEYDWTYDPNTGVGQEKITQVEKTYELPAAITAKMTIGGTAAMELTSTYSYHDDNLPKAASVSFKLGGYTAKADVKNDNKVAETKFSLAKGAEVLIAASSNSNFNTVSYDKISNAADDELADLLVSANTTLRVGAVTMAGHLDFKTVYNAVKPILDTEPSYPEWDAYFGNIIRPEWEDYNNDNVAYTKAMQEYEAKQEAAEVKYNAASEKYRTDYEKYEKAYNTALATALNKNGTLVLANNKTKEKIASITFELDEEMYKSDDKTRYSYEVQPLLVFGDGSKVDFETFGDTGFQKLIDDMEDLINKFGSK